jgi:hypothetical protein
MSKTPSQQIANVAKCVNKLCLKQNDILEKQNYILESNGWDRNCDPVCLTISGPSDDNNSFYLSNGTDTAANVLFERHLHQVSIGGNTYAQPPIVFTPNKPVCVYLQPNDELHTTRLTSVGAGVSPSVGGYKFIVTHGGTSTEYDTPVGNDYIELTQSLAPNCVVASNTGP